MDVDESGLYPKLEPSRRLQLLPFLEWWIEGALFALSENTEVL